MLDGTCRCLPWNAAGIVLHTLDKVFCVWSGLDIRLTDISQMVFDEVERIMLLVGVMPCQSFGIMHELLLPVSAVRGSRIVFGINDIVIKAVNGDRIITHIVLRMQDVPDRHRRQRFACIVDGAHAVAQGVILMPRLVAVAVLDPVRQVENIISDGTYTAVFVVNHVAVIVVPHLGCLVC